MHIVADENIPLLEHFCGHLGPLTRVNGRTLGRAQLMDADVLLVRSVTRVDADLLTGTPVRFVGTATIGTDHVDTAWLSEQGIAFSSAPGCNATSVVQYVLSVLSLYLLRQQRTGLDGLTVGVVGAGKVGGALVAVLAALGVTVRVSDPPLEERGASGLPFAPLEQVLTCDVVSLHTPLTTDGVHATNGLLDARRLSALGAGQLLISSGRGPVLDNQALLARLKAASPPLVALDVWEDEPDPLRELVDWCWLATPHIAGYSLEGKSRGTEMIARALHQWAGLTLDADLASALPAPLISAVHLTEQVSPMDGFHRALMACYDPRDDDSRLRGAFASADAEGAARGAAFDNLRKHYPIRREPSSLNVRVPSTGIMADMLSACGFVVTAGSAT